MLNFELFAGSHGERGSGGEWGGRALYLLLLMTASVSFDLIADERRGTSTKSAGK